MAEAIRQVVDTRKAKDTEQAGLSPELRLLKSLESVKSDLSPDNFSLDGLEKIGEYPEYSVYKWDDEISLMEIREEDKCVYIVCDIEEGKNFGILLEIPLNK